MSGSGSSSPLPLLSYETFSVPAACSAPPASAELGFVGCVLGKQQLSQARVSGHGQASSESRQRSPRGRLGSRPSSGKKSLWDLAAPPTPPDSTRETFRVGDLVWLNFAITLHRTCCWGWGPSACLVSLPRGFCHFQAPASPGDAAQLGAGQCRPSVNQTSLTRPSPRFPSGDRVPQAPGGL